MKKVLLFSFVFLPILVGVALFSSIQRNRTASVCSRIGGLDDGVHYLKRGNGPPIVFLHGAGANLRDYVESGLVEKLSEEFTVYLLDRPGSGFSLGDDVNEKDINLYQVEKVLKFIERQEIQNPILVGHSLGAAIASATAARLGENIGGLMLLAGAVYPIGTGSSWYTKISTLPLVGYVFNHWLVPVIAPMISPSIIKKNFFPNEIPENYIKDSCLALLFSPDRFRYNSIALNQVVPFMQRQLPLYKNISAPISMIYGAEDKIIATKVHSSEFKKIHDSAHLHMLKGVGHLPHHSHQNLVIEELKRIRSSVD